MAVRYTVATKKAPNPIDKHVGARVRMRRLMCDLSQTDLGDALGITFQQVQKYDKGTNRISASRLHRTYEILQVPVEFFFEGRRTFADSTLHKQALRLRSLYRTISPR